MKGLDLEENRMDYRAAWDMLANGWAEAKVMAATRNRSLNNKARHRALNDYAKRTAASVRQRLALVPKVSIWTMAQSLGKELKTRGGSDVLW